jgi:sulfoxide reductase heme-binding subunit YedZ
MMDATPAQTAATGGAVRPARAGARPAQKRKPFRPPWQDRHGRLVPIKAVVFPLTLVPGLVLAAQFALGDLGSRPLNELIHGFGLWSVRFLVLTLAVTPLASLLDWPRIVSTRRLLGLTALSYVSIHFALYCIDQSGQVLHIASEIVRRYYLTIGFVALCGMVVLGVHSTDASVRRLGRNWKRLHRIVYVIAALGILHYFMQVKADVYAPTVLAGVFVWLMLYRVVRRGWHHSPGVLLALGAAAAAGTLGIEAAWYGIATRIPLARVVNASFAIGYWPRPAQWIAIAGAAMLLVGVAVRIVMRNRHRPPPPAQVAA